MKYRLLKCRLLLCAALLLFVYACEFGVAPGGGGTTGDGLTGIIVDSRGAGVAGAKVRVYPEVATLSKGAGALAARADSTVTDSKGAFRFSKLADGRYNLEVSLSRNDTIYSLLIRSIDFVKRLDLGKDTLQAAGSLRVQVQDEKNAPVGGAACVISGSSWRAVSNAQGECVITGVAPGEHPVSVTVQNITVVSEKVLVTPGKTASGGTLYFNPVGGGNFIPADWVLTSLQGYAFFRPPQLKLVYEGYGIDSWDAQFRSGSITLQLGSGMTGPLEQPVTFPEYAEADRILDSAASPVVRGLLITYRVPDSAKSYYQTDYIAGLQIHSGSASTFQSALLLYRAACATQEDQRIATRILKSVRKWKGPGPEPLPPPLQPVLRNPDIGPLGVALVSTTPSLSWVNQSGSTLTTHYRLQVATDSLFVSRIVDDSVKLGGMFVDTLVKNVGPLLGSRYYWRVVAVGPGGSTPSPSYSFIPVQSAPLVPILESPAANATGLSVTPKLSWYYTNGISTTEFYRVQVSSDSLFGSLVAVDSVRAFPTQTGSISWTLTRALTENRRYFWRVIAVGPQGATASETRAFETTPTGYQAVPVYPTRDTAGIEWSPSLTWSPYYAYDTKAYHRVQIARDSVFSNPVVNDSVNGVLSNTGHGGPGLLAGPLSPATRYYWRVLTYPGAGTTYGRVGTFTTRAATADSVPRVPQLTPAKGGSALVEIDSISFSWTTWNRGPNTSYYHLQVSIDSTFLDPVFNDTLYAQNRDTGLSGRKVGLKHGVEYYWRVLAVGPGGITSSLIQKVLVSTAL